MGRSQLGFPRLFASVGAIVFDLSLTDIDEAPKDFQPKCSQDELSRSISKRLYAASRVQYNLIIRPRSTTALLVQLDDFDEGRAARMEPYAFMTVRTSTGNYQVWFSRCGWTERERERSRQTVSHPDTERRRSRQISDRGHAHRRISELQTEVCAKFSHDWRKPCQRRKGGDNRRAQRSGAHLAGTTAAPAVFPRELAPQDRRQGEGGRTISSHSRGHP
jgi:hypothetical protein